MLSTLFWPIVCLLAGLLLLLVEVFVPSGGLIGLLALGLLGVCLWQAFLISTSTGGLFVLALTILVPAVLALAVNLWPRTPMGRLLLLEPPGRDDVEPETEGPGLEYLVGQYGRTLTPLRPSGVVDFDGRRLDGLSEEGLIPSGALVRAVQLRGRQLVVRPASAESFRDLTTT